MGSVAIEMRDVELEVRVGEHPWEKFPERPTRILVSLTLSFDYAEYFGKLGGFVDYDPLRNFLKDLEKAPHVEKIETMARSIVKACFAMTPAAQVRLSLSKPDIFNEMQGVGLTLDVTRAEFGA